MSLPFFIVLVESFCVLAFFHTVNLSNSYLMFSGTYHVAFLRSNISFRGYKFFSLQAHFSTAIV